MVVGSKRQVHRAFTSSLSTARDTPAGERFSDYTLREADEQDLPDIEALFEERGIKPGWAAWKYFENPAGAARVLVAEDPCRKIVGTLAFMPREFTTADGGSITALLVVDAYVDSELRNRGVFLGLMDYARRRVEGARFSVPNKNSTKGRDWHVLGSYRRWQFPVSIGSRLAARPFGFLAPLLNGLSRVYRLLWLTIAPRDLEMIRITRFSRDFELNVDATYGVRSAAHLNWRFIDNPVGKYRAYEFFDQEESVGYCVLTHTGRKAVLSDFVTLRHARGCLRLVIDLCWRNRITHVSIDGVGHSLGKLGFIPRSSERVCTAVGLPEGRWIVTRCDVHTCVVARSES